MVGFRRGKTINFTDKDLHFPWEMCILYLRSKMVNKSY